MFVYFAYVSRTNFNFDVSLLCSFQNNPGTMAIIPVQEA